MAVQGKLVPQDPNDEPASVLLERIRAEKQRLVAEGKIKKSKNESVIYRVPRDDETTDNLPYAVVEYDLPSGWELCKLNDLYNFIDYRGATPNKISSGVPFVTAKNVKVGYTDYAISEYISFDSYEKRKSRGISQKGDILFTTEAPLGNVALADLAEFSAGQRLITLQNYSANVPLNNMLFMNFLLSDFFKQQLKEKQTGTTVKGIKAEKLKELIIPLPPLAEQHRIVERIEELLPHIAAYDTAEQKQTALNATFPDALKKSILQAAVQGKLAPQDPADEPASVLLERIRVEKEALIKAGKVKRDKHESVIFRRDNSHYEKVGEIERCIDDEIPFDVPDSWAWARLGSLVRLTSGQDMTPDKYNEKEQGIPYLTGASNIENGNVIINRWTTEPKSIAENGDLLITCKGTVGAMAVLHSERAHIARQIMAIRIGNLQCREYVHCFLETYISVLKAAAKSMIPGISRDDILTALFPIPPFQEQLRIVERIEKLSENVTAL